MATTALDEEKKRKAIGYAFPQNPPPGGSIYGANIRPAGEVVQQPDPVAKKPIGFSFPQNPPEDGSIYKKRPLASDAAAQAGTVTPNAAPLQSKGMDVLKASTPASAPEKPAPSLNAPWYSREYAAAANMSDKGGLELERMRAAGATGIPQDDPARRLITTGTLSTGQPQPISSNEGRNAPAPAQVQKPSGLSVVSAPAQQAAPQQSAQQPVGQQSMQPTAPQQTPNTVNGRDVGLTSPDNGFRSYPAERGFNFDKFQPKSGEGAFRNEQTGQVTRLSSPGVAAQPVQQARGVRIIMDEPQQVQQAQPARQPVVMPQLNTGGGVFASMANFANQASQAYAQGVQNKAIRKEAERNNAQQEALRSSQIAAGRLGLDSFRAQTDAQQSAARMQDEASTNALRRKAVQADLDTKAQLDAARQEYLAAGDDPAKQKAAARKLAVLSGKDGQKDGGTWDSIVVGGGVDELGRKVGGTAMLYNKSTGEVRPIGEQQAQAGAWPKPSDKNIAALKSDPSLAAAFDQQFGAGASKQYIQGK